MTMKSSFYPVIGDKIFGWMGDAIDTISVATTLFGVCTSLGLGVIQLNSGAARLFKSCITGVSCFDIMFACARQCIAAHAWLLRRSRTPRTGICLHQGFPCAPRHMLFLHNSHLPRASFTHSCLCAPQA